MVAVFPHTDSTRIASSLNTSIASFFLFGVTLPTDAFGCSSASHPI